MIFLCVYTHAQTIHDFTANVLKVDVVPKTFTKLLMLHNM